MIIVTVMTELDEALAQLGHVRAASKLGHALVFGMAKVTHNHLLHQRNYASFDDWAAEHGYKGTHGLYMARVGEIFAAFLARMTLSGKHALGSTVCGHGHSAVSPHPLC